MITLHAPIAGLVHLFRSEFWEAHRDKLNRVLSGIVFLSVVGLTSAIWFAWKIEPPANWTPVLVTGLCLEGIAIFFSFSYKSFNVFLDPFGADTDEDFGAFRRIAAELRRRRSRPFAIFSFVASVTCFSAGIVLIVAFAVKNFNLGG